VTPPGLILVVIDGLTPEMLEAGIERGDTPTLAQLVERGAYRRAVSAFPSLTPVCLTSISTGSGPDVHEIPHLVWYHRGEQRLVEYGSSFAAIRASGLGRAMKDALVNMNASHLGRRATTVFEALDDAGVATAAVNFTAYRGRTLHRPTLPLLDAVLGPRRFFFYNLFESDATGAPLSWRNRAAGTVDAYAAAVGRWLVTRDGFDFFVFYLSDYDLASHERGPDAAHDVLSRCDAAVGELARAAGGVDELLERYALVVLSDHGQTRVTDLATMQERFGDVPGALVTASNRAGMIYRLERCRLDPRELAQRLDGAPFVEVALFREGDEAVARREREELRFSPDGVGWRLHGDASILSGPDAPGRAWAALACPNAGEVIVSAAAGWELADLAGRHHLGGGSHGSLCAGDSEVPVVTVGVEGDVGSIVDVAPLVLRHFGVAVPPARPLERAA
jgi:Type I phosphodiesterase / nucleotide pyrophosphatase